MSYFTALVVRLGLYFWGLPLPRQKEGAKNNSNTQQNSAALREDVIPFHQLSQCFGATNSMLLMLLTQCFGDANSML